MCARFCSGVTYRCLGRLALLTRPGPKGDGAFTAAGGIGLEQSSSLYSFLFFTSRFHLGGELNLGYSSFRGSADHVYRLVRPGTETQLENEITSTISVKEAFALNLAADWGLYIFESLMLFNRLGYAYIDSSYDILEVDRRPVNLVGGGMGINVSVNYAEAEDGAHAFIVGGGMRYQLSQDFGVRFYYLRHIGRREADELRFGFIWRLF